MSAFIWGADLFENKDKKASALSDTTTSFCDLLSNLLKWRPALISPHALFILDSRTAQMIPLKVRLFCLAVNEMVVRAVGAVSISPSQSGRAAPSLPTAVPLSAGVNLQQTLQILTLAYQRGAPAAPDHQLVLHGPLERQLFLIRISFRALRIDQLQINNEA